MKKLVTLLFLLSGIVSVGQIKPLTVAERSKFKSTATHRQVMDFIRTIDTSAFMRVDTIAVSEEGRLVPLLVIGNPLPQSVSELNGRIPVYIQANIHAGEVEGKEASLMFARDVLAGLHPDILQSVVLLICPILNPDGNDRISPQHRTWQNGPENGVGVRHNALYLDLNRDAMKLETAGMRGVVANVLNRWDPAIVMDCHTTNGSFHQEPVTFTWMMNPNGDRKLIEFMRDRMMPEVSAFLRDTLGVLNCFYGEFVDQHDYSKGWISYASKPRFFTNYVGLRNRLSILNENYVYAPYRNRVYGAYALIRSVVRYAARYGKDIAALLRYADSRVARLPEEGAFAIRYSVKPTPRKVTILTYDAIPYTDDRGRERFRKGETKRTVTVPYLADYFPDSTVAYPFAYLITRTDPEIIERLELHGIAYSVLSDTVTLSVEEFTIDSLRPIPVLNQGHYTNRIYGSYSVKVKTFWKGVLLVRVAQPLGRLAVYLLEPNADDGFLYWNFWDKYLKPQWGRRFYPVPVYRISSAEQLDRVLGAVR